MDFIFFKNIISVIKVLLTYILVEKSDLSGYWMNLIQEGSNTYIEIYNFSRVARNFKSQNSELIQFTFTFQLYSDVRGLEQDRGCGVALKYSGLTSANYVGEDGLKHGVFMIKKTISKKNEFFGLNYNFGDGFDLDKPPMPLKLNKVNLRFWERIKFSMNRYCYPNLDDAKSKFSHYTEE